MSETIGTVEVPSQHFDLKKVGSTDTRNILGVHVRVVSCDDAIKLIENTIENNQHQKIAFLNAHGANIAYGSFDYRKQLENFIVLADGIGIDIGSKALYGHKFPSNLNGTDFMPQLFESLKQPARIGLLGGKKGVAERAAHSLNHTHAHHEFISVGHGFFSTKDQHELLQTIEHAQLDILMVALGNPIQERWIYENCTVKQSAIAIGVGAFFDFCSGHVPRAPSILLKLRMEWLYRLFLEPSRMWRRYLVGNPLFIARVYKQKFWGLPWGTEKEK